MARKVGGVDARHVAPITPKVGPAHGDLVYHGGPTISCPRIHATFWGPNWSDRTHQAQTPSLVQFLKDPGASTSTNGPNPHYRGHGAYTPTLPDAASFRA